jgi:TatD DNase family protein
MFLIDSHCHLNKINYHKKKNGILDIIKKAYKNNVKIILSVSTSIKDFQEMKKLLKNVPYNIFYSCGIHPLYSHKKKNLLKN